MDCEDTDSVWLGLTPLIAAITKRRIIMKTNNKKNHLSHIMIFFIMLLFAACLTVNAVVCSRGVFNCNHNLYEQSDQAGIIETQAALKRIDTGLAAKGDGDDNITRNKCPIPVSMVLSKGYGQFIFLVIAFLFFYKILFIVLSERWTLIDQKVRLDN